MSDWHSIIDLANKEPAVLISVIKVEGSTPRDTATHMLVTPTKTAGTIGGGQLEYKGIFQAREILSDLSAPDVISEIALGPAIGQCCGGHASLLLGRLEIGENPWTNELTHALSNGDDTWLKTEFKNNKATYAVGNFKHDTEPLNSDCLIFVEPVHNHRFHLYLFGAGHVGRAVVAVMSALPCAITWIDSRADEFPDATAANTRKYLTDHPLDIVTRADKGAYFLVMTHSHQLDLEICEQILKRQDFTYAGLIGSATKRAKFEKRLALRQIEPSIISRLTCPVGVNDIAGKHPAEIAISVAAEILQIASAQENKVADNSQLPNVIKSFM